jgi:Co/Zn/Cd efflux system component
MLVLYSTIGVLKSSIAVLLEETPSSIDWKKVYNAISALPGVDDVHVSVDTDCVNAA